MAEEPITHFEMTQARLAVEAVWLAARQGGAARDKLLGLEMYIQGMAAMRGVDAEIVRGEVAAMVRGGRGLDDWIKGGFATKGNA